MEKNVLKIKMDKKITEVHCEDGPPEENDMLPASVDVSIHPPSARIKALADIGNAFQIDYHVPPKRYYRSGLEMVRMADVYLNEGSWENAYILYMKFMTLFLEKIRKHPDFKTVPVVERAQNDAKLKEVLPKAEKLKMKLLEIYEQEHKFYLKNKVI